MTTAALEDEHALEQALASVRDSQEKNSALQATVQEDVKTINGLKEEKEQLTKEVAIIPSLNAEIARLKAELAAGPWKWQMLFLGVLFLFVATVVVMVRMIRQKPPARVSPEVQQQLIEAPKSKELPTGNLADNLVDIMRQQ